MPQSALFTGIIPPVSTIFTADGQLDKPSSAPKSVKPLPGLRSIMSIVVCRC